MSTKNQSNRITAETKKKEQQQQKKRTKKQTSFDSSKRKKSSDSTQRKTRKSLVSFSFAIQSKRKQQQFPPGLQQIEKQTKTQTKKE
jgi:hypothetical protein